MAVTDEDALASVLSGDDCSLSAGNGLLFVLLWPTFSSAPAARFLCASVPALAALHFALVGLGIAADEALVRSATVCTKLLLLVCDHACGRI
jgi:hypothetical protein